MTAAVWTWHAYASQRRFVRRRQRRTLGICFRRLHRDAQNRRFAPWFQIFGAAVLREWHVEALRTRPRRMLTPAAVAARQQSLVLRPQPPPDEDERPRPLSMVPRPSSLAPSLEDVPNTYLQGYLRGGARRVDPLKPAVGRGAARALNV
mmetsp:Transcript_15116/g.52619  ORF Transcript_15116/g.52619 Transcript_15116/m.52619 type:complete len:149 (-) Transcript_15116:14-460(-)